MRLKEYSTLFCLSWHFCNNYHTVYEKNNNYSLAFCFRCYFFEKETVPQTEQNNKNPLRRLLFFKMCPRKQTYFIGLIYIVPF